MAENRAVGPIARRNPLPRHRRRSGWTVAAVAIPVTTVVLVAGRDRVALPTVMLLYLVLVVAVASVGGTFPALAAAVSTFLVVNWYFTPPFHTWTVAEGEHLIALLVFLVVAGVVSLLVTAANHQAVEADRARTEAETLAGLSGAALEPDPLPMLLERLCATLGLEGASVLRGADGTWTPEAYAGHDAPADPTEAEWSRPLGGSSTLALRGTVRAPGDRRVLEAFTAQLAGALTGLRLRRAAANAEALGRANELRTALLAAVSHDLRTPLASIKASVTSLRAGDVRWAPAQEAEFLATIEEAADRLDSLVGNLLDMSRLQAGALELAPRAIDLEEVVPSALASLGLGAEAVEVELSASLPPVEGDPGLLERTVANLVANAAAWSPPDLAVRIEAAAHDGTVELRIVDHGPGIPPADRERVFEPFQQRGDSDRGGVGLGLAVSRGFVEAMGGELRVEDTPGGGVTMVVRLPPAS